MLGTTINNYRLVQELGSGGMATVYRAEHLHLKGRQAAVKLLHPALSTQPYVSQKFYEEAERQATFTHPGIVKVHDFGVHNGGLYLIMDYVAGRTLEDLIRNETGPLPEARALHLFGQILHAVGYAHTHNVIHRDLKPGNLIITPDDKAVVIDFGIARTLEQEDQPGKTGLGTQIGTPTFMSPEQVLGAAVDRRTDIYSLGVVLFGMVTGKSPYEAGMSTFRVQTAVVNEALPRLREFYPYSPVTLLHGSHK